MWIKKFPEMKKFNILVLDNNVGNRTSLQEMLVANDFLVKTATNFKTELFMLTEEPFDLIFIESEVTLTDSFVACQKIKSNSISTGIPVIFIIGHNDLAFVKEIYTSGGDDYIVKPLVWSELLMKTRIHLELKYSRRIARNINQILEDKVARRTVELEDSLKKLELAKKELEKLSIAKSEFLNLISHEIRTPLNGILGSMALIGRYNFSEEVNHYFSLLDTSVKRLEKFSNIILEASTLRLKGEKILKFVDADLIKLLRTALDQCTEKYSEKELLVEFQNNTINSLLLCDGKYLFKCFIAVLDNSFKFSPQGGKVEIKLTNEAEGFFKITISDHGKGFSKAALENIYYPLSNLEAHFDQNTGMGLHLAKLIVDAHSGFIKVGNHKPTGAVIEILIPARH
jgi:two-component system sensor histidine kinase/response regulator